MKVIIRPIRLHQAKALENLLNDMVKKNYALIYQIGPVFLFKDSGEVSFYQVIKSPKKREKYLDFCEEFGVQPKRSLDYRCLNILESTKQQSMGFDDDMDSKIYQSMRLTQLTRMVLLLVLTIAFVFISFMIGDSTGIFASESFENYTYLLTVFLLFQIYDIGEAVYYWITKKETERFKSDLSIKGILYVVWGIVYVAYLAFYTPVLTALIVFIVMIMSFRKYKDKWDFIGRFLLACVLVASLIFPAMLGMYQSVRVFINADEVSVTQNRILQVDNQSEYLYSQEENRYMLWDSYMVKNEKDNSYIEFMNYYYFKPSPLKDELMNRVLSAYKPKKVIDNETGEETMVTYVIVKDENEIIVFLKTPSLEMQESVKRLLDKDE